MANKKIQGSKAKSAQSAVTVGSLWLAGVGAMSLARKRSELVLGELITEGRRLQGEATRLVREARDDAQAQLTGITTPLRKRLKQQVEMAGSAVQAGIGGVLSRLGIPSKADIDELAQRVAALSRQLKAK